MCGAVGTQGRLAPWHPLPVEVFALYPNSRCMALDLHASVDLTLGRCPRRWRPAAPSH